jgi:glucokinase
MQQYIGIDLGGTNLRAVRIDQHGQVYRHLQERTTASAGPEAIIAQITALVEQTIGDHPRENISGVGVGSPGPLNPYTGIVHRSPNLRGWRDVPLCERLHERLHLPVVLNNDGNAATLGEWCFGSGQGCQDFIYIGIGTGLGGGVIVNGQLLMGRKGLGGEIGHMQVAQDGPFCSCGAVGCWESLTSGSALTRFANQALENEVPSLLQKEPSSRPVTVADIFHAAEQEDGLALDLLRKEGEYLGRGLVSLLHLFSPERIALGGGVAQGLCWFEQPIRQVIRERAMPFYQDIPIQYAQLGDRAGVIGAAALLFKTFSVKHQA